LNIAAPWTTVSSATDVSALSTSWRTICGIHIGSSFAGHAYIADLLFSASSVFMVIVTLTTIVGLVTRLASQVGDLHRRCRPTRFVSSVTTGSTTRTSFSDMFTASIIYVQSVREWAAPMSSTRISDAWLCTIQKFTMSVLTRIASAVVFA